MMKCILTLSILLLYVNLNSSINNVRGNKLSSIIEYNVKGIDVLYQKQYSDIIEVLKKQEGFRAYYYDDKNFQCIGYGQRTKFYSKPIQEPITVEQATLILEDSYNQHIRLVKRVYPKANGIELLSLAKISYQSGIVKVIKLMKNRYELQNNNQRTTID